MSRPIARVIGVGARAPLGMSCLQVAMGVRARRMEPVSTSFLDRRGRSVGLCKAGGIADHVHGYERLLALAAPALREAVPSGMAPLPLLLALPEADRPDDDPRFVTDLVPALSALTGVPIDLERSRLFRHGHAGGAFALEAAAGLLRDGAEAVLVGGVDSHVHPAVMSWLDSNYRLHALEAENGIVPSEGSAFLLLTQPDTKRSNQVLPTMAHLLDVRTAEENTVFTNEPNLAAALTRIVAQVAAGPAIEWVFNDVNGERHRIREWSQVELRTRLAAGARVQRPADDLGDIGAASGPMFAALACAFWSAGCAPARRLLVALCSEGTGRGAFTMERGDEPPGRDRALFSSRIREAT